MSNSLINQFDPNESAREKFSYEQSMKSNIIHNLLNVTRGTFCSLYFLLLFYDCKRSL